MAIPLIDAIRKGNVTLAKRLLSQRRSSCINSQTSRQDGTALFWACCHGFFDIASLLLLNKADPNITTSWNGSPLHAACDNNHLEIVRLLIQFGANLDIQTTSGDTPCHLAAYRGFDQLVQALVESGANTDILNKRFKTPLTEAEGMGHKQIVRYLVAVYELNLQTTRKNNELADDNQAYPIYGSEILCHSINTENDVVLFDNMNSHYSQDFVSNDLSLESSVNVNKLSFRNI